MKDLGAEELVAAVGLGLGARANLAQVAAGAGFGEVHRTGPAAVDHLRDVLLLAVRRCRR
jgi:hypothetical protein